MSSEYFTPSLQNSFINSSADHKASLYLIFNSFNL
nr:MAG TPA: hypothetical protein [Bacteriophage sp.]